MKSTSRLTVTVPTEVINLLPAWRRSEIVTMSLIAYLKLDPVTLTPMGGPSTEKAEQRATLLAEREAARQAKEEKRAIVTAQRDAVRQAKAEQRAIAAAEKEVERIRKKPWADKTREEKIAAREEQGYIIGGDPDYPDAWALPDAPLKAPWHPERQYYPNSGSINLTTMETTYTDGMRWKVTGDDTSPPAGETVAQCEARIKAEMEAWDD